MALYNWTGSAWSPSEPAYKQVGRSSSKNVWTQYPVIVDDIDGTAEMTEVAITNEYEIVALTLAGAQKLQGIVEALAVIEGSSTSTSGGYSEDIRQVGSYRHRKIVVVKNTYRTDWYEGPPEEPGA
jgi:hypothetical protein